MADDAVQQEVRCPSCRRLVPASLFEQDEAFCPHCNARISTWQRPEAASPPRPVRPHPTAVVVNGVDIPFFDLVWLMVKVSLAAIPAAIILAAFWFIVGSMLFGATGGL